MLVQGEYPKYADRIFEEENVSIDITEEDIQLLKENPVDYLSFSYYLTCAVSSDTKMSADTGGPIGVDNPYLQKIKWGWAIDPCRVKICM